MSVRTRLLVFNVTLMLVTVLTLGGTFYVFGEQYLHHAAIDEISRSSHQALVIVEHFFQTRLAEQKTLSGSTFFYRKLNYDQIQQRFEHYRHYYQTYHSISFFDPQRIRRIDLNRLDLGFKTDRPQLFDRALAADGPVYEFDVSNPLRPMVHFLTKLQRPGEPLVGYVFATVPLTNLHRTLIALSTPQSVQGRADVQLFGRDGSRIYSRFDGDSRESLVTNREQGNLIKRPLEPTGEIPDFYGTHYNGTLYESRDEFTIIFEHAGGRETVGTASDSSSWKLAFRVSKADLERPIIMVRKMILAIVAVLFLIAIALNRWLSQSLLLPIENLTTSLRTFKFDQVSMSSDDMKRTDEIGVLTRGVYELTERLKTNFAELSSTSKFTALGEMAAGIAHEINNPLTVIIGKAMMLGKSVDGSNSKVDTAAIRESADKIIEMVHRITRTIHALRVYARSGENDAVGVESVQSIITSTLDICSERLRLSSIRLEVDIDPPDAVVIARPVQVSQILMNLLNNAHDAIVTADRESGSRLPASERWIRMVVRETETHVLITIENGGPKISNRVAERLFEPFFTTKPAGVGTGLGLTISQRLASANGAALSFDSKKNITRFVLQFPRPDLELLTEDGANTIDN